MLKIFKKKIPQNIKTMLTDTRFLIFRIILKLNSYIFFNKVRMKIYKLLGMSLEKNAIIWCGAKINHPDRIFLGENSVIGPSTKLLSQGIIEIGKNVNISGFSFIISQEHNTSDPQLKTILKKIIIEDYAWIATNVTILPGVRIGKGAVVGAGAVVTKSVKPFDIVAGNPAIKIGKREEKLDYKTFSPDGIKWL